MTAQTAKPKKGIRIEKDNVGIMPVFRRIKTLPLLSKSKRM